DMNVIYGKTANNVVSTAVINGAAVLIFTGSKDRAEESSDYFPNHTGSSTDFLDAYPICSAYPLLKLVFYTNTEQEC
ncbi:MAG: hypothetical protein V3V04_05905, partial [Rhizobiaceae bacterium]